MPTHHSLRIARTSSSPSQPATPPPSPAPPPPSLAPPPPSHAPVALPCCCAAHPPPFCAREWPFCACVPMTPSSPFCRPLLCLCCPCTPPLVPHVTTPLIHRRSTPTRGHIAPALCGAPAPATHSDPRRTPMAPCRAPWCHMTPRHGISTPSPPSPCAAPPLRALAPPWCRVSSLSRPAVLVPHPAPTRRLRTPPPRLMPCQPMPRPLRAPLHRPRAARRRRRAAHPLDLYPAVFAPTTPARTLFAPVPGPGFAASRPPRAPLSTVLAPGAPATQCRAPATQPGAPATRFCALVTRLPALATRSGALLLFRASASLPHPSAGTVSSLVALRDPRGPSLPQCAPTTPFGASAFPLRLRHGCHGHLHATDATDATGTVSCPRYIHTPPELRAPLPALALQPGPRWPCLLPHLPRRAAMRPSGRRLMSRGPARPSWAFTLPPHVATAPFCASTPPLPPVPSPRRLRCPHAPHRRRLAPPSSYALALQSRAAFSNRLCRRRTSSRAAGPSCYSHTLSRCRRSPRVPPLRRQGPHAAISAAIVTPLQCRPAPTDAPLPLSQRHFGPLAPD
ncbi:hypothetical protein DENSPDRAFT_885903 [Dentipellis sp. KUC8613]|nr:hypothetical protein DENSPDRAFT_885903 [Dentipellis sp. KUC8613]